MYVYTTDKGNLLNNYYIMFYSLLFIEVALYCSFYIIQLFTVHKTALVHYVTTNGV